MKVFLKFKSLDRFLDSCVDFVLIPMLSLNVSGFEYGEASERDTFLVGSLKGS